MRRGRLAEPGHKAGAFALFRGDVPTGTDPRHAMPFVIFPADAAKSSGVDCGFLRSVQPCCPRTSPPFDVRPGAEPGRLRNLWRWGRRPGQCSSRPGIDPLQGGEPAMCLIEEREAASLREEVGQLRDGTTTRCPVERGPQGGTGYRLQELNALFRHLAFRLTESKFDNPVLGSHRARRGCRARLITLILLAAVEHPNHYVGRASCRWPRHRGLADGALRPLCPTAY